MEGHTDRRIVFIECDDVGFLVAIPKKYTQIFKGYRVGSTDFPDAFDAKAILWWLLNSNASAVRDGVTLGIEDANADRVGLPLGIIVVAADTLKATTNVSTATRANASKSLF